MINFHKNKTINQFEKEFVSLGKKILNWQINNKNKKILNKRYFKLEADLKADFLLKKLIKKYFPNINIVSEENSTNELSNSFWIIDPIDGTRSFFNNFDGYVIQASYVLNNLPVYSIIYSPVKNKKWTAVINKGAFLNEKKIKKSSIKKKIRIIDNYPKPKGITRLVKKNFLNIEYLESGSIGLKAVLVADGSADIFVKDVIYKDWDIIPALLVNKEVGNKVCDFEGNEITFKDDLTNSNGLIVCRKYLYHKLKKILQNIKNTNYIKS